MQLFRPSLFTAATVLLVHLLLATATRLFTTVPTTAIQHIHYFLNLLKYPKVYFSDLNSDPLGGSIHSGQAELTYSIMIIILLVKI